MAMILTWSYLEELIHSSGSMIVSPDGIFLASAKGSHLVIVELASPRPSYAKVKAPAPDDEPNKCRTAGACVEEDERLYVKTPIGWSNLQLGPNLQIPYRE